MYPLQPTPTHPPTRHRPHHGLHQRPLPPHLSAHTSTANSHCAPIAPADDTHLCTRDAPNTPKRVQKLPTKQCVRLRESPAKPYAMRFSAVFVSIAFGYYAHARVLCVRVVVACGCVRCSKVIAAKPTAATILAIAFRAWTSALSRNRHSVCKNSPHNSACACVRSPQSLMPCGFRRFECS